jgi:GNAT superfamily N-acetyltransferase
VGALLATAAELADRAEFAAYADMWAAAPPAAAVALGLVAARVGPYDVVGCASAPDAPMLNRVLGVGLEELDADALAAAIALLHERGCTCQVSLRADAPETRAAGDWLARRGFVPGYPWMRFALPPEAPVPDEPPGAAVRARSCLPSDAAAFGTTFALGYGLPAPFAEVIGALVGRPGWRCLVAETPDGRPAGTGALHLHGGAAWLGLGATAPALRRRGAQGAVLRARIREARALGCDPVVTETGERVPERPSASYRNILRAGFVERGLRANLVAPPPAGAAPVSWGTARGR